MSRVRSVAGGGRAVELEPERIPGWFARFGSQHNGVASTEVTAQRFQVIAGDGVVAWVTPLFDQFEPGQYVGLRLEPLLANVRRSRRLGVVLARLGGHSVGIALDGRVLVSATDRRLVHGRNKAGGWSQQRFARRREGQAQQAVHAAADDVARVLVPRLAELDGVVLGGDRSILKALSDDCRLADVFAIAAQRVLDVGEPRRTTLDDAAARVLNIEVVVNEPTR